MISSHCLGYLSSRYLNYVNLDLHINIGTLLTDTRYRQHLFRQQEQWTESARCARLKNAVCGRRSLLHKEGVCVLLTSLFISYKHATPPPPFKTNLIFNLLKEICTMFICNTCICSRFLGKKLIYTLAWIALIRKSDNEEEISTTYLLIYNKIITINTGYNAQMHHKYLIWW